MYCIKLTLKPTAGLTFRILPGSILNIATYPFVPPTSLSGFLRRIAMMQAGLDIPETDVKNPPTYLLPPRYVTLGAYLTPNGWSSIHRTYRKGMREFSHDDFSKLHSTGDRANFQLHTWEYLITEQLVGYVIAESSEGLRKFQAFKDYGCFIGKEGYAVIKEVSQIIELKQELVSAYPSTVIPVDSLIMANQFTGGCDIYNLYRYNWLAESYNQSDDDGFWGVQPTAVNGFTPFVAAHFPKHLNNPPTVDYYTDGTEIFIPISLVELLRGETYAQSL